MNIIVVVNKDIKEAKLYFGVFHLIYQLCNLVYLTKYSQF